MRASRHRRGRLAPRCWAGMKKGCRAGWFRRGTRKVAVTYLPLSQSIGAAGLNFSVRNGRGGAPVLWPPEVSLRTRPDEDGVWVKRSGRSKIPTGWTPGGRHGGRRPRFFFFLGTAPRQGSGLLVPLGCARCRACTCAYRRGHRLLTALHCGDLISRAFVLDAFSTYLAGGRPTAVRLAHNRYTGAPFRHGPLVLVSGPLQVSLPPTTDRDELSSTDRSEPSSRSHFNGEQPQPLDLLPARMYEADIDGAKPLRSILSSWEGSALFIPGYLLFL